VLLRNSLDLNQPLSEVSPGTQVTRRELFPLGKSGKVDKTTIGSHGSANRLSLATKYMRADSSSSAAASRNNCEDKSDSQTRPVSLVFAKFATPVNPENKNSGTAIASLAPKHVNVLPRKKEVLLAKQASGGRQRVTSAVRRVSTIGFQGVVTKVDSARLGKDGLESAQGSSCTQSCSQAPCVKAVSYAHKCRRQGKLCTVSDMPRTPVRKPIDRLVFQLSIHEEAGKQLQAGQEGQSQGNAGIISRSILWTRKGSGFATMNVDRIQQRAVS
jgi:hypothetical protein